MALTVTPTDEMKTLTVGNKIYEVVDDEARTELTDVKADLKEVVCSNLMGNEANVLYPVKILAGSYFTVSTSDGSVFPTDSTLQVQLLDSAGTQTDYFTLKNGATSRTIITEATRADTYYLRWNEVPSVPLMVNYGSTALPYQEYFPNILFNVEQIKADLNNSASTYNAERHWFVAGRYLKGDDNFETGNQYAYSLAGIFNLTAGLIKITSLNGVFDFSVVDRDAHTLTAWSDEITIASGNYTVNLRKKDGTDIIGTDINDVEVRVLGFDFYGHTHIKLDETKKLLHYSNLLSGRQLINSGDKEGVGDYTTGKYNATKFALYSDKNIDIWVGRYDICIVDVFINGLCVASVSQGEHYTIEANTNFVLGWHNANSSVPDGANIFLIVDGAEATHPTGIDQYFANPTTFSRTPDIGCSFLVNDKIFSISDNGTYCVTRGETVLIQNATLDVSAGHANSCNFFNDKVYVSDWDDPATIHVYDVDSKNNALTHSKDIMLGVDAETGSTEYFVFDDEKQIISLGWKTGDSGTNPNVLTYALWLSTTGGYVKAWERYALRPTVLQSMTVQNGYIYYINCYGSSNSYKFIGVNRINIETGVTEYTSIEPDGSILSWEGEGIIPIGNEVFLIVMNNGRVYLFAFV